MCMLMGNTVHGLAVVRHVCLEAKISMHCNAMGSFMVAIHQCLAVQLDATQCNVTQCHACSLSHTKPCAVAT